MLCAVQKCYIDSCAFFVLFSPVDAYPCSTHSIFVSRVHQGGSRLWRRALISEVVMRYLFCLLLIGACWGPAATIYSISTVEAALSDKKYQWMCVWVCGGGGGGRGLGKQKWWLLRHV